MPLRFLSFLTNHVEHRSQSYNTGLFRGASPYSMQAAQSTYTGYTCSARPRVSTGRPRGRHLAAAAGAPCCAAASAAKRPRSVRRMFSTIGRSVPASGASASGTS